MEKIMQRLRDDWWRKPLGIIGLAVMIWGMFSTVSTGSAFGFLPQSPDGWQWFGLMLIFASETRSRK